MQEPILTVRHITKTYPGVVALNDVSMTFVAGEIHALLGENGAGKSTLIKVISGAIEPDQGSIVLGDQEYTKMSPALAKSLGVAVIYQEFSLVESLSVAQNVFLGENRGFLVSRDDVNRRAAQIFAEMNVALDPTLQVRKLSPAKKQLVEIAKAISGNAKILIMDEPSAPLSAAEVETMFAIIRKLKEKGVTIIYISHRLEELFRIADRVTVMRDGCYIDTLVTRETQRQTLINLMVGRELKEYYPKHEAMPGDVILEVKHLSGLGDTDISFAVKRGEILGIAGLVGSGRTELASLIYGVAPKDSGEVWIDGEKRDIHSPAQAIAYGIGLIPEDRKHHGCILNASVRFNITLSIFKQLARWGIVNTQAQKKTAGYYIEKFNIRTPSMEQRVRNLSGGNQQKVVLAKTLAANTNILIFDEPTRGIDVGAKQEIYHLMVDLVNQGKTILMISSDMEELLGMSDRLIVLCEGEFMGEVPKEKFDQRYVIELASGHH
ncbi:MAG TPA: sugar ABC transporter ATP-binding protein [Anaerolineae bacterium]|nr:sugar ABC transporter ATP-binding protein [Anaerolineae bacterium]HQI85613.1 sugar ABC transporter ATP-binding protein [Anaerolineae bacterium]